MSEARMPLPAGEAMIARSWLFVPGNRPERFAKALAAGAHAVIIDLEDAVPPADKDLARDALAALLSPGHPVVVRINGADTPWFAADLALCGRAGIAGIMLPKAESRGGLESVAARAATTPLLPLIETAAGFANLASIAATPGVERLIFGSIDFQLDLGIEGDGEELQSFRSALVLASRLAGILPPVDGVCTTIDDAETLRADALRGRRFGFGGKLCIHPKQVATVNAAWRPDAKEVAWAERIVAAAAAAQGAAVAVDGRMVDRPVILRAERILNESRRPA